LSVSSSFFLLEGKGFIETHTRPFQQQKRLQQTGTMSQKHRNTKAPLIMWHFTVRRSMVVGYPN
jgi:hypothetical protein